MPRRRNSSPATSASPPLLPGPMIANTRGFFAPANAARARRATASPALRINENESTRANAAASTARIWVVVKSVCIEAFRRESFSHKIDLL